MKTIAAQFGKGVSGNKHRRNDRRHAAARKSRRKISDESRVVVRRGWVGVADRVREPGKSFCRPRSSARARIRHSRRRRRQPRADRETAFSRKFRHRDYRRSARIFHRALGAGCVVDLGATNVPPAFRRSHSICRVLDIHVGRCTVTAVLFGLWPAWQSIARRRSAGVESRLARKRRCAISQTHARLARH